MSDVLDVARYFVELSFRGLEPEGLTPPRLQKLLYFAQGWHLGAFDRPLFPDEIVAGPTGPEVPALRAALPAAGRGPAAVVKPGDLDPCGLPFRDRRFVEAIWAKYQEYSAAGLHNLVSTESPWVETRAAVRDDAAAEPVITADALRRSFGPRPELHHFDPREWEGVCEGEAEAAAGKVTSLAGAMGRLRSRCATK